MKNELKDFCKTIGCSGMGSKCPGNPECQIIKNIKKLSDDIEADKNMQALNEAALKQLKINRNKRRNVRKKIKGGKR